MFVCIFLISFTSALDFDNIKEFKKGELKYGQIDIYNSFLIPKLIKGDKLAEYTLTDNSNTCLINCYAEGTAILYEKRKLFDDLKFIGRDGKNKNIKSSQIYIQVNKSFEVYINDYEKQCTTVILTNGSYEVCEYELIGNHPEQKYKLSWKEYDNKKLNPGNYTWRIQGQKDKYESIDWIVNAFGEEFTEWAWWNTSVQFKQQLNFSTTSSSQVRIPYRVNSSDGINGSVVWTLPQESFDSSTNYSEWFYYNDFSDIHIVNTSETEELPFEVEIGSATSINPTQVWNDIGRNLTILFKETSGNPTDSSPNGNSIALGGLLWRNKSSGCISGNCVFSDGTNASTGGIVPFDQSLNFSGSSVTIEVWLNYTSIDADWDFIVGKQGPSHSTREMAITRTNLVPKTFGIDLSNGVEVISNNGISTPLIDRWYYIVAVCDIDNSRSLLYVNAILEGNISFDCSSIPSTTTSITIGNASDSVPYAVDGLIDNVRYTGRVLTSDEIKAIYEEVIFQHSNLGDVQSRIVETTLIAPENDSNFNVNNITFTFNSSAAGRLNLTNVTLLIWYNNGSLFHENFTSLSGEETVTTIKNIQGFVEGEFIWNALTKGTEGSQDFDVNRTFATDLSAPIINVTSPTGIIVFHKVGNNLSLNWTITESNLDACWFEYNSTNTTVTCADNNYSFSTTIQQNLTFYANDSVGNLGSNFTSWEFLFEKYNVTFNNQTFGSSLETFTAEIILGFGETISEVIFYYNNINYTTNVFFSEGEYSVISSILVPAVESQTNFPLGFFIVVGGETYDLETFNQTVINVNISECFSGDNLLLNMSLKDEVIKSSIVGDIEVNAQVISKSSGETAGSVAVNFANISSASLCLSPLELFGSLYLDAEIKYSSDNYAPELYHIQKADLSEYPKNLSLFDLSNNLSTEFLIKYQDDNLIFVEGAVIQLQRKYISENLFEIVEAPLTSDIGTSIVHIDLNTNKYQATVVKDGVVLDVFLNLVFNCENPLSGQCTENLFGKIDSQNDVPLVQLQDFAYSIISANNTITTLFTIPSGTPSLVNIVLTQRDQFGNSSLCNQSIISSGGSLDCTFEDTIGDSFLELKISKDTKLQAEEGFIIVEDSGLDFLGNNFFIVIVFLLSIVGMSFSSPEWMIINAVFTMTISGAFWLLNGLDFVVGLGSLMYLIIAAGILIKELSKQEDQ